MRFRRSEAEISCPESNRLELKLQRGVQAFGEVIALRSVGEDKLLWP